MDDDELRALRRTAYREAAHAVIGAKLDFRLEHIVIRLDASGTYTPTNPFAFVGSRDSLEAIYMTLAGRLGESLITGAPREADDDWLREVIHHLRSGDNPVGVHDDTRVLRTLMAWNPDATDSELIEEYRICEQNVVGMLSDPITQTRIQSLAQTLFDRMEMGEEAIEVIDEDWRPLDDDTAFLEIESTGTLHETTKDEDEPM